MDNLLHELGLSHVADSRVGTQFRRGISGGEKKRLSIGCQLITDPVRSTLLLLLHLNNIIPI